MVAGRPTRPRPAMPVAKKAPPAKPAATRARASKAETAKAPEAPKAAKSAEPEPAKRDLERRLGRTAPLVIATVDSTYTSGKCTHFCSDTRTTSTSVRGAPSRTRSLGGDVHGGDPGVRCAEPIDDEAVADLPGALPRIAEATLWSLGTGAAPGGVTAIPAAGGQGEREAAYFAVMGHPFRSNGPPSVGRL
jgi:hypothetical protein